MDKRLIRPFFDQIAPVWDAHRPPGAGRIERIFGQAAIVPNVTVLDAACGTGLPFPHYLGRGVIHITGVDLSRNTLARAGEKYPDPRITLVCGDAETPPLGPHGRCVALNAFPHFPEPEAILTALCGALRVGGRLTIAHGEGPAALDAAARAGYTGFGRTPRRRAARHWSRTTDTATKAGPGAAGHVFVAALLHIWEGIMNRTRKTVLTALCVAIGVVLPLAFHSIPNAGSIFLPMHIPVLLCGLLCGWQYGLVCGVLTPLVASLVTGMPPMAYLPAMLAELAVYGLISGLAMRFIRTGKTVLDVYLSLIAAMLLGRAAYGALNALVFRAGAYSLPIWLSAAFVTCLPGIAIQVALIPALVLALQRANVAGRRYPNEARG